jgi:glycosyltransferase involved in cell wall biosynthesis
MLEHDALICPYTEASQSGVVAEAMSWGLPALVTPVGGLPEQVGSGRGGIVTSDVSPDSLRQSLLTLLTDRTRLEALSGGALKLVAERRSQSRWPALVHGAIQVSAGCSLADHI